MATESLQLEVRGLLQHPVDRFDLRNPRLRGLWERVLPSQYYLPDNVGAGHGEQPGTSSHLANLFLATVSQYPRLEQLFSPPVVSGGQGHCRYQAANGFPIEMRAGRKHFYQHRIDFALYGDALVIGYATDFTYEMLTATERAEFTRHVKPGQWKRNFEQYFKAFVKQKPAYLPDEPKPIQQAKLSILDSLFEPVVLAKRAGIVANFTYRKWQDQV